MYIFLKKTHDDVHETRFSEILLYFVCWCVVAAFKSDVYCISWCCRIGAVFASCDYLTFLSVSFVVSMPNDSVSKKEYCRYSTYISNIGTTLSKGKVRLRSKFLAFFNRMTGVGMGRVVTQK